MRPPSTNEQKLQQRIDSLIICFAMTSIGLVSLAVSILSFYLFRLDTYTVLAWALTSIGVCEAFGITAVILFLSSKVVRRRLISIVKEVFTESY